MSFVGCGIGYLGACRPNLWQKFLLLFRPRKAFNSGDSTLIYKTMFGKIYLLEEK